MSHIAPKNIKGLRPIYKFESDFPRSKMTHLHVGTERYQVFAGLQVNKAL